MAVQLQRKAKKVKAMTMNKPPLGRSRDALSSLVCWPFVVSEAVARQRLLANAHDSQDEGRVVPKPARYAAAELQQHVRFLSRQRRPADAAPWASQIARCFLARLWHWPGGPGGAMHSLPAPARAWRHAPAGPAAHAAGSPRPGRRRPPPRRPRPQRGFGRLWEAVSGAPAQRRTKARMGSPVQ